MPTHEVHGFVLSNASPFALQMHALSVSRRPDTHVILGCCTARHTCGRAVGLALPATPESTRVSRMPLPPGLPLKLAHSSSCLPPAGYGRSPAPNNTVLCAPCPRTAVTKAHTRKDTPSSRAYFTAYAYCIRAGSTRENTPQHVHSDNEMSSAFHALQCGRAGTSVPTSDRACEGAYLFT